MRERALRSWQECCWALGVRARPEPFDALLARWSEPHRHYHDLSHLDACLRLFDEHRSLAERPGEVCAALLFHDAIYDPTRGDSERESARLACTALAGAPADALERIARTIESTGTHESHGDADEDLVLDIDLAILGAEPEVYDAFERAIRAEYAHVSDEAFGLGRRAVLTRFEHRSPLYRTDALRDALEAGAHANLQRTLRALGHDQR